jgi:hypothetical protein
VNIFHRLIADQAIRSFCASLTQQAVAALALDAMEWRVLEGLEAVLRVSGVNMPEIHDDPYISGATLRSESHV